MEPPPSDGNGATDAAHRVSVGEVLALPVLQRGEPTVVAGRAALGRGVRWVHVRGEAAQGEPLSGGELVLATGIAAALGERDEQRAIDALVREGASALMVSFGPRETSLPAALVDAAEAANLPLVALGRTVQPADVTEAIHGLLVERRLSAARHADQLQDRFIEQVLRGDGAGSILRDCARLIGNPVVLEDHARRVVELAPHRSARELVVTAWEQHRSAVEHGETGPTRTIEASVVVRGRPWGRLVALAIDGAMQDRDRLAIEKAAVAVALDLHGEQSGPKLRARARGGLIAGLAQGQLDEREAEHWAMSLGMPEHRGPLLPAGAVWRTQRWTDRAETETAAWEILVDAMAERTESGRFVVAGTYGEGLVLALDLGTNERSSPDVSRAATELRMMLEDAGLAADDVVLAIGRPAAAWTTLGASLERIVRSAASLRTGTPQAWHDARRGSIVDLLFGLRAAPQLVIFVREQLGPLLDERDARASELLRTLETYLESGGRKAEAARALHLERQSLYGRLERIEATLGIRLSDADTLLGLHLAIRALRIIEAHGERPRPIG